MKFTAGLVLAAVAVAGAAAESTPTMDPKMIEGLGPMTPAGDNPKLKKAMESLAGSHDSSSSSNYYTIDPKTLPTMDPKYIGGLGPAVLPGMPGWGKNEKANKAWEEFQKQDGSTNDKHRQLESTQTLTIDHNTPTMDPKMIEGLGPQTPAGANPKIKQAMDSLAGSHDSSSGSNYYTIDPKTLPTASPGWNPAWGLGPAVLPGTPGWGKNEKANKAWEEFQKQEGGSTNDKHRQLESTQTLQVDPNTPTMDPKMIEGLGPMTPAGNNPKLKKAMESLEGSHASSSGSNYYTIDPKTLPTQDPKYLEGLGPQTNPTTNTLDATKTAPPNLTPSSYGTMGYALLPGMPGYGQNAKFNKAWKEFLQQEGASTSASGSSASNCAQVCPEVYDPVCGSDGVKYSNSCFLGIASCKNPEKHITKAADDACLTQTTQTITKATDDACLTQTTQTAQN
ncbi:hypothetical protein PHMEG_00030787 [Phytophthora megakarya]|uniref:Kazal-like domain-containing protein n=1 Tax=Phytophthora megakarya TaxID=4795 RepID=A0A225V0E6_9STRA|nr:hypothetical protein PHMEG_00030787 [Phytophthora megakarya]